MKIIVHRGIGVAEGNCIEVRSKKTRILLDYGAPRPVTGPVSHTTKDATLNIPGLYEEVPLPLSAIILSHTHQTHYGALFAKPIKPGIKVFMTEIMEDILRITAKMPLVPEKLDAGIEHFRKGHRFVVGNIGITPYLMDHSAAESFAFLIETEGKRLIYTGDFREHGSRSAAFRQFLAADMGPVDVLITEGAQADIEKGPDERSVMKELESLVEGRDGTLYVMCSAQNTDMIASLAMIAKNTRRYLVVDGYMALLLERLRILARKQGVELKLPGLHTEYLRVVDNNATKRISELPEYAETYARMRPKMIGWDSVKHSLNRLIIPVRANAQHWVDRHIKDFKGAALVYSTWEDYREETGLYETLEYFKARGMTKIPIPTSGHAYFSTIRKLVENKRPLNIIPVHTRHPEKFVKAFGKRVRVLKNGEEFFLY